MRHIVIIGNNLQSLIKANKYLSNEDCKVTILSNGEFCNIESPKDIIKYQRVQPLLMEDCGYTIGLVFSQGFLSEEKINRNWKLYPIWTGHPTEFLEDIDEFTKSIQINCKLPTNTVKDLTLQLATKFNLTYTETINTNNFNCITAHKFKVKSLDNTGNVKYYKLMREKWADKLSIKSMIRIINYDSEKNVMIYDQRGNVKSIKYDELFFCTNKLVTEYLSLRSITNKRSKIITVVPWEYKAVIFLPNNYKTLSITGIISVDSKKYYISVEDVGEKFEFAVAPEDCNLFSIKVIDVTSETEISVQTNYRAYYSTSNDAEYKTVCQFIENFIKSILDIVDSPSIYNQNISIVKNPIVTGLFNTVPF